ncbi:MAG: hypothetical protein KGL74_11015 [Elusimicrobia bacterium]|nr:hypothetical protein [Elusimicrobiota bacterium]
MIVKRRLAPLFLASSSLAAATTTRTHFIGQNAITLTSGRSAYSITEAQVIADSSRTISLEQVRELEKKGTANWSVRTNLNFGFSSDRYWPKIPISNLDSGSRDWAFLTPFFFRHRCAFGRVINQQLELLGFSRFGSRMRTRGAHLGLVKKQLIHLGLRPSG